jgi:hypothetical protein
LDLAKKGRKELKPCLDVADDSLEEQDEGGGESEYVEDESPELGVLAKKEGDGLIVA